MIRWGERTPRQAFPTILRGSNRKNLSLRSPLVAALDVELGEGVGERGGDEGGFFVVEFLVESSSGAIALPAQPRAIPPRALGREGVFVRGGEAMSLETGTFGSTQTFG